MSTEITPTDNFAASQPIFLSIVIPSYNSGKILEKNLPLLLNYLSSKNYIYEIIIVDDGSTDNNLTLAVAEQYHCLYLKNDRNLGKGAAVKKGMLSAHGAYRIFTDADIPYEFETIDKIIYYLDFKEFQFCGGDRTLSGSDYHMGVPWIRKIGSRVFSSFVGRLVAGGLYDTQCGVKGFRAAAAHDLFGASRINGFAFDVELYYIALKRNYDIKKIPVKLRCSDGNSVKLIQHGLGMVWEVSMIIINYYRGKYNPESNRRTGDKISIDGGYQYRALHNGPTPQRFWHHNKLREAAASLNIGAGDTILDAGCGSGVFCDFIPSHLNITLVAVDSNENALDFAQKKYNRKNVMFKRALIDELDFPDNSFDKIVFLEVIEHITGDQADKVLAKFNNIIKPNGKLIISTPNKRSFWPLIEKIFDWLRLVPHLSSDQHELLYDYDSLQKIVENRGFICVQAKSINTFSPWVAPISWKLAEIINKLEMRYIRKHGNILLFTFQKK